MAIILSLDISTKSTGYALFIDDKYYVSGTITSKDTNWLNRVRNMSNQLSTILLGLDISIDFVVVEDSYAMKNIATVKKLCITQGLFISKFPESDINFVYPTTWKAYYGLTKYKRKESKEQSLTLAEALTKITIDTDDQSDATLLGYYFIKEVIKK